MSNTELYRSIHNATPQPPKPKFRIITDTGVEFVVEVEVFDLNFRYGENLTAITGLSNTLRLLGKILSPTSLPSPAQFEVEPERQIFVS